MYTNGRIPTPRGTTMSVSKQLARIPTHRNIIATGTTVTVVIGNRGTYAKFTSKAYKDDCEKLLAALKFYNGLATNTKLDITFPAIIETHRSIKDVQCKFVGEIIAVLSKFVPFESFGITLKAPEIAMTQVRCLESLYGLTYTGWTLTMKEGERVVEVNNGDDWDRALYYEHERCVAARRQAVAEEIRARRARRRGILGPDGYSTIGSYVADGLGNGRDLRGNLRGLFL